MLNRLSLKLADRSWKESNFVLRRKTSVAFLYRIPPASRNALVDAVWKCRKKITKVESYGD